MDSGFGRTEDCPECEGTGLVAATFTGEVDPEDGECETCAGFGYIELGDNEHVPAVERERGEP